MSVLDLLMATGIRHYRATDTIPPELRAGFEQLGRLDADWVWVVERDGFIEGVLVAAPCHGAAMVYRLALLPGVPLRLLTKLLRTFLRDIRDRGCVGYLTFVDPDNEIQGKLKRVMERVGGKQVGGEHVVMAAPLPRENI